MGPPGPTVPFLGAWEVAPLRVLVGSKLRPWLALLALSALLGCEGDEAVEAPGPEGEGAAEVEESEASFGGLTVSTDLQRLTVDETVNGFPHGAHGGIVCAQCHTAVLGHDTHETVDCADCHQGSAFLGERVVFARNECLSCHHGPEQVFGCQQCHSSGPDAVTRSETLHFAVWTESRERILTFDHLRHETVDCGECHSSGVLLEFDQECTSCHVDHHQPASECTSCHVELPLESHELDVHLGCGGAECHEDALPAETAGSRTSCLSCHREQVEHEVGGDCASCHQVGALGAGSGDGGGWSR